MIRIGKKINYKKFFRLRNSLNLITPFFYKINKIFSELKESKGQVPKEMYVVWISIIVGVFSISGQLYHQSYSEGKTVRTRYDEFLETDDKAWRQCLSEIQINIMSNLSDLFIWEQKGTIYLMDPNTGEVFKIIK